MPGAAAGPDAIMCMSGWLSQSELHGHQIIRNKYLVFVPGSEYRAFKTLGISCMMGMR